MSDDTNDLPRRRGGQPGNLNHLKHGLYIEGRSIRNTTPIERAQLFDLGEIISRTKDYMNRLYEEGLKCKTIAEYNLTMHNISSAAMALTRLISIHNQFQNTTLPSDLLATKETTMLNLVEHYKKKMASVIDLSELESNADMEGDAR